MNAKTNCLLGVLFCLLLFVTRDVDARRRSSKGSSKIKNADHENDDIIERELQEDREDGFIDDVDAERAGKCN